MSCAAKSPSSAETSVQGSHQARKSDCANESADNGVKMLSMASTFEHKNDAESGTETKVAKRKRSLGRRRRSDAVVPNMSRRAKHSILVAFPSFDKCDSLIFFASTLSRLSNSGDMTGVNNLFRSRFARGCHLTFMGRKFDLVGCEQLFKMFEEMYPDYLECVSDTKVDGRTIVSTTVSKCTSSNTLYKAILPQLGGTQLQAMLPASRGTYLRNFQFIDEATREAFVQSDLPDSDLDFIIYGTMQLTTTVDATRGKITHLEFSNTIKTIEPVPAAR